MLTAGAPQFELVRTHSEVIEQFDRFLLIKLLFLLEIGIAGQERLFLAKWHPKMTTQSREKNCEDDHISKSLTGMESCPVDRGSTPAPKDATKLAVLFRFFESFLLDSEEEKPYFRKTERERWERNGGETFRPLIGSSVFGDW